MNPNVIQFACNHCQSWLTVPAHLAGVAGPCPKCGQHIVSPRSSQTPPVVETPVILPAPAYVAPVPQPEAPQPARPLSQPLWGAKPGTSLPQMPAVPIGDAYPPAAGPAPNWPPARPAEAPAAIWGALPGSQSQAAPLSPRPPSGPLFPNASGSQASLLNPGGFLGTPETQGPAAAPPQLPPNAIAQQLGRIHEPVGHPTTHEQPSFEGGGTIPLSRPMTIGGSRLSLLARQLATGAEGGYPLPPSPVLSNQELPGANMGQTYAPPDAHRHQQANSMMFQNTVPRGQHVTVKKSSGGFLKLAIAALFIFGSIGTAAWYLRKDIIDALGYTPSVKPQLPETVDVQTIAPVPDVVPAPTPSPSTTPAPQVTVVEPTLAPTPQAPAPTPPVPAPSAEKMPPRALPISGGTIAQNNPPPRAMPVEDEPPVPPAPIEKRPVLAQGVQTTRTPEHAIKDEAPAPPVAPMNENLVEVGRLPDSPKVLPEPSTEMPGAEGSRPIAKNVPPVCNPALTGLKNFLAAPTWRERLQYMMMPDQMRQKAETYYASNPDGPVEVDEIHYLRHDEDPQVGSGTHVVFVLFSRAWDYGFPVMVEQKGDDARVDWLTFVEFKDDLLNKFLNNYMEGPVRFHVGIRRTHYFEDDVPNRDEMDAFEISTPMENAHGFVFTPSSTPLARSMNSTISWDKEASWVIVELQWRRQGSTKWIEITGLPQLNWYSGNVP
ncbi:MAG: hypothetical protein JNM99_09600 [Verrucomicrobiaceae bacterium]|nr:hypothetical protein [Verrucomicrobiaceae bacterium]